MESRELCIAVVIEPDNEKPVLEIYQHNIPTRVGEFISEDHAKLFVDILNRLLNDK